MPTTLSNVYTQLTTNGVLLTNQFKLVFAGSPVDSALTDVTIWASGANVPGREQKVLDFYYYGFPLKVPGSFDMDHELTLDVRCDKSMIIRDALIDWKDQISSIDRSTGGIKTLSTATCRLWLLDQMMSDNFKQQYLLKGIYPTKISDIAMKHDDPGIATFSCIFTYQWWERES